MVMDRINGFSNLGKELWGKLQGSVKSDSADQKNLAGIGASATGPLSDPAVSAESSRPAERAEISHKAHQLNALRQDVCSGQQALDKLPDVRQDRVAVVQARLSQGYYNSIEVRQRVAERLDGVARKLEDL